MTFIDKVGKFSIFKFDLGEQVERGCKFGVIETSRLCILEDLLPCDFDFHKRTLQDAYFVARAWS